MSNTPTKQELTQTFIGAYLRLCRIDQRFKPFVDVVRENREKQIKSIRAFE